jgi:hypothetical protein
MSCSYSEAVEYLYSTNAFSLSSDRDEIPTVNYLSYYFLPQRLVQVRELRIHWQLDNVPIFAWHGLFPSEKEDWFRSWEAIRKMTGLRRLHVNLEFAFNGWGGFLGWGDDEGKWEEKATEMLAVVKEITAPSEFVVYLPDAKCSTDLDPGNSKCVFKIPEEHEDAMRIRL